MDYLDLLDLGARTALQDHQDLEVKTANEGSLDQRDQQGLAENPDPWDLAGHQEP